MYYEIREMSSYTLQLNLEDGKFEKPKISEHSGKSFRVLKDGVWGYFVGEVGDKEGIERAKRQAIGKGDVKVDDRAFRGRFVFKPRMNLLDIDIEEKIGLIREIDKLMRRDGVVSRRITYIEAIRKVRIENSNGGEIYYEVPRCGIIMQAFAKGETLQFYSERVAKVGGFEIAQKAIEKAEKTAETAVKLSNAKAPPSGEMNVVMNPSLTGVFIHEAFGHGVEGDHVLQNFTVLKGKIGEKVAHESVNVYDDPTIHEFGFFPFDDEGYRAERKAVIENGILKTFLNSRETAVKLDGNAGNARSDGLEIPLVRMSNTYLSSGEFSLEELLEIAKNGVLLFGSRGGETNPATGQFHFNAQFGYIIERGEVKEMVRDVSLGGNTLEILKDIKIGKDVSFDPGFCGKAGQIVPVADGGPFTLVKAFVGGA